MSAGQILPPRMSHIKPVTTEYEKAELSQDIPAAFVSVGLGITGLECPASNCDTSSNDEDEVVFTGRNTAVAETGESTPLLRSVVMTPDDRESSDDEDEVVFVGRGRGRGARTPVVRYIVMANHESGAGKGAVSPQETEKFPAFGTFNTRLTTTRI